MSLIEMKQVAYQYPTGRLALSDVNLQIEKGERVVVLGPNGAGKSTLFQLFNGLLLAKEGTVTVAGLSVEKKHLYAVREKVGMVFQDPDDQLFNSTVRQEIAYGLNNMRLPAKETKERIDWALEMTGMADFVDKSPHSLSGGQKKRVALASVLAMQPEVLVLDEPTAALDPHGVYALVELLQKINQDLGITLIFSTHDTDMVPLLAQRVYLLADGKVVSNGPIKTVFKEKQRLRSMGLRLPRVAHLAEILQKDGLLPPGELPFTIGEARKIFGQALRASKK
ncbi:MAG TPA: energy-coupling factor ABC transporter ATP-binding protein [Ruminococcaceae bacterium]|nr:energy-coupling factor ABC transporter ATP-binding protein [Oscillospiraceae bacterium]